ncbi:MAG: 2-C-methyl-D-erythritol 4-phosphate cytidylyltransferase [Gammaproteobacteria bacterium]
MTRQRFWVIIPAAGAGARFGATAPKQYLPLAGATVIEHTINCFTSHPVVAGIVVVLAPDDSHWSALGLRGENNIETVSGGEERCHSVANGLRHLSAFASAEDWVLVHDAARPNLPRADLDRLIDTLVDDPVGGILATPVRDTMKRSDNDARIRETVDRTALWHALTPQMFRLRALSDALQRASSDGYAVTDEASAMEYAGLQPQIVEGSAENIKITRPEDLALAAFYLGNRES